MNGQRQGSPTPQCLALFDLDGTLIAGASSERRFAAYLLRRGELGILQGLSWLSVLPRGLWRHGRAVSKKNKGYLVGLEQERLCELAHAFVEEDLVTVFDRAVVATLAGHYQRGDLTVLLSGTLQALADAVGTRLGVAHSVGTWVPERAGRYVDGLPLRHPYGWEKLTLAERLCADYALELEQVVAYADSIHDRFLLERVGEAIAVEPDRHLARLAEARGWRILHHTGAGTALECWLG